MSNRTNPDETRRDTRLTDTDSSTVSAADGSDAASTREDAASATGAADTSVLEDQAKPRRNRKSAKSRIPRNTAADSADPKEQEAQNQAREQTESAACLSMEGAEDDLDLSDGSVSDVNPYGWGLNTTPPGRVRFLRFFTWSTLTRHLVSLRDSEGKFLAPGYFAAVQATRSAGPVIDALRQRALQQGLRLCVHQIFVPVVYPDVVPFRYWQHCTNPFDHTMVTLHYLHKKIVEGEVRRHFAQAIPEGRRFTISSISSLLLKNRTVFQDFFNAPESRNCRGIIWRDAVSRLFGQDFPHPGRLVNYAVLRPEWIVDAQPVDRTEDLIGSARKMPEACLKRLSSLLVLDEESLMKAEAAEVRRDREQRRRRNLA